MPEYRFDGTLWRYEGDAAWHFVTLPVEVSDDIAAMTEPTPFGSVRVRATIGDTTWETSLFPDSASDSYLLPVKRSVRARERLSDGASAAVDLIVPPPVT